MGGTVNVISKGAFDRTSPLLSYRLSAILNSNWVTLRELPGGQPESTGRRILLGLTGGVAAYKAFTEALSKAGINIQMISTSEIKTAVIVDEAKIAEGANVVHEAFGLAK